MAHVTLSVQGNIATITLNRPKALNALTLNDYQLLADLMRRAASDDAVVATVIKGTGKYFSACVPSSLFFPFPRTLCGFSISLRSLIYH